MGEGRPCKGQSGFKNGITNGAKWYPLIGKWINTCKAENVDVIVSILFIGGMQDYNYVWHGCMEITLEISCCKYPPASDLPRYWEENRNVSENERRKS